MSAHFRKSFYIFYNHNETYTVFSSSLIHKILLDAHTAAKEFRVIVVDGRPWLEGKEQLRRLAKHGIECSYILINALSYIMPEVSKNDAFVFVLLKYILKIQVIRLMNR